MQYTKDYFIKIIEEMIKYYKDTGNKEKLYALYKNSHFLYVFDDMPPEYFEEILCEYKEICTNR